MKFTTRWILAIAIVFLSAASIYSKDLKMFMITTYPLIVGWFIGELLNIPEVLLKRKWRNFKDKLIISLFNFLYKAKSEEIEDEKDREYFS